MKNVMLPALQRVKLALTLTPAILFPSLWAVSLLIAPQQNILWSALVASVAAFVAAYSITSFIEYLRVLRGKQ